MLHSAGRLLRTVDRAFPGNSAAQTLQRLTLQLHAAVAVNPIASAAIREAAGFACCSMRGAARPNGGRGSNAAKHNTHSWAGQARTVSRSAAGEAAAIPSMHTAAAVSAYRQTSGCAAAATAAAAVAARRASAALRPAAHLLRSELHAVFQPALSFSARSAQAAPFAAAVTCRAAATTGGAAACSRRLCSTVTMATLQQSAGSATAGSAAAATPASAAVAGHAAARLPRLCLRTASRRVARSGTAAGSGIAKQQARAYNGYRVAYRSPYASVSINRDMDPMKLLYGVIGANPFAPLQTYQQM